MTETCEECGDTTYKGPLCRTCHASYSREGETVELPTSEVDTALEELEQAMQDGEAAMSHDTVRPSTHRLANQTRDAYRTLVEAHPDYELTEGDDE